VIRIVDEYEEKMTIMFQRVSLTNLFPDLATVWEERSDDPWYVIDMTDNSYLVYPNGSRLPQQGELVRLGRGHWHGWRVLNLKKEE